MLRSIKLRQNINIHGLLETAAYINTSYADPWWAESTLLQDTIGSHIKITINRKINAAKCTHKRLHTCKVHISWQVVPDTYNTSIIIQETKHGWPCKCDEVASLVNELGQLLAGYDFGQCLQHWQNRRRPHTTIYSRSTVVCISARENLPEIISTLFHMSIAAHKYFPACSTPLK